MEESFSPLENWLVHLYAGTTPTGVDLTSPTCRFLRIPQDDPQSHPLALETSMDYSLFYAGNVPRRTRSEVILPPSSLVEVKYVSRNTLVRLDIALCITEAEVSIARCIHQHMSLGAKNATLLAAAFNFLQMMGFASWQCLYLLTLGEQLPTYLKKVKRVMMGIEVDISVDEQPIIDRIVSYKVQPPTIFPWPLLAKALQ